MDEVKHTPGPWVAYENKDDNCFYVAQQDGAPYTPNYSDVCALDCRTWGGERLSVQRANARLIAAVPELLEALTNNTLNKIMGMIEDSGDDAMWAFAQLWMEQRDAAIRKAKGEE